jgi:hypothetical protein
VIRDSARICVTGYPRSGKTTVIAPAYPGPLRSTDDLLKIYTGPDRWSQVSEHASHWLDEPGPWCIEGTPVARAIRKWLERTPEGKPCDVLIVTRRAHVPLSTGQESMGKGVITVMGKIYPELVRRGVEVRWV